MGYYDWNKIVKEYKDQELKRVYREKSREPIEKVEAVIEELINRGLLNSDSRATQLLEEQDFIYNIDIVSGNTKPNTKFSKYAIIAIVLAIIINAVSIISSFLQYELLLDFQNGILFAQEILESNDKREMSIGIIGIIAYLVSSITFLIWFYRAYQNLTKRISNTEYSPGWTIGSWFIPIISLFKPFNIMSELNKKTNLIIKSRMIDTAQNKRMYIGLWWGLFLTSGYVGRALFHVARRVDDVNGLILITTGDIIVSTMKILLGLLTIKLLLNFARIEELLYNSENNN
jgi:hypothetical protein